MGHDKYTLYNRHSTFSGILKAPPSSLLASSLGMAEFPGLKRVIPKECEVLCTLKKKSKPEGRIFLCFYSKYNAQTKDVRHLPRFGKASFDYFFQIAQAMLLI